MRSQVSVKEVVTASVEGDVFVLSQKPSPVMDFRDEFALVSPDGNQAVIGYLIDDLAPENPLTASDANGVIYTNDRRSGEDAY